MSDKPGMRKAATLIKVTLKITGIILFSLIFLEISSQILYKAQKGHWFFSFKNPPRMFELHPWLLGSLRKGISKTYRNVTISHDPSGARSVKSALPVASNAKIVVVFGGSSTYGTGVSDEQTWPSHLQDMLGPSFKVINAGVPGYSTAEHIIQTALQSYDLRPDIAIYYVGWNDVRNLNIKNLRSDYSDFHGLSQFYNLSLFADSYRGQSALIYYLLQVNSNIYLKFHDTYRSPHPTQEISPKAIDIYKYNLKTLIQIGRAHNIQMILVPQVLNYDRLTENKSYGWIPFIKDSNLRQWMGIYNEALLEICRTENVSCIRQVLDATWNADDFVDHGHFNDRGGKKFAQIVSDSLVEYLSSHNPQMDN